MRSITAMLLLAVTAAASPAFAQTRSSANYTLSDENTLPAVGAMSSADYVATGAFGEVAGQVESAAYSLFPGIQQAEDTPTVIVQPLLRALRLDSGTFHFIIIGSAGQRFTLQSSSDLLAWDSLETVTAANGEAQVSRPADEKRRFYRAIALP